MARVLICEHLTNEFLQMLALLVSLCFVHSADIRLLTREPDSRIPAFGGRRANRRRNDLLSAF
jgi:hypothetical protein